MARTPAPSPKAKAAPSAAPLGIEDTLWKAADQLRGNMDASEYKHVVLGLIFLKYISDAFEERRVTIYDGTSNPKSDYFIAEEAERYDAREQMTEDRDEYAGEGVFWVPAEARWENLQAKAKDSRIGVMVDSAMALIEQDNPSLKGVLPKNYARPDLDTVRLGEVIDLISGLDLGGRESRSKDVIGRVYEYFLGRFASAEGKGGGEFYTPQSIVRLLVEMIEPLKGRVYDPCCGSGGMFVQSEKFVEAHGGRIGDISVYGQESNATTWRLAKMNLAIRGIDSNLGPQWGDSFRNDLHRDLRADYILANPPFNISAWGGDSLKDDARWTYGVPPSGNANYAWIQHFIHHLSPTGVAGFVMANGSLSSNSSGEGDIRQAIVGADLVDCIVSLPGQLFYSTQIPVCLWFLSRDKSGSGRFRDRRGETLFIDARQLGYMSSRIHRALSDDDLNLITSTYHAWRGQEQVKAYVDVAGFAASAITMEIREQGFALTPGRYVGAAATGLNEESNYNAIIRLVDTLDKQMAEAADIDGRIREALQSIDWTPADVINELDEKSEVTAKWDLVVCHGSNAG